MGAPWRQRRAGEPLRRALYLLPALLLALAVPISPAPTPSPTTPSPTTPFPTTAPANSSTNSTTTTPPPGTPTTPAFTASPTGSAYICYMGYFGPSCLYGDVRFLHKPFSTSAAVLADSQPLSSLAPALLCSRCGTPAASTPTTPSCMPVFPCLHRRRRRPAPRSAPSSTSSVFRSPPPTVSSRGLLTHPPLSSDRPAFAGRHSRRRQSASART